MHHAARLGACSTHPDMQNLSIVIAKEPAFSISTRLRFVRSLRP